jgi:hypothetical protein
MTDYTFILWQHTDGRRLPFNHPDAYAERLKALASLTGKYPDIEQPADTIQSFHPPRTKYRIPPKL